MMMTEGQAGLTGGGCWRRNPAHADVFASASGDRTAKVWDARSGRTTLSLSNHTHEVRHPVAALSSNLRNPE